MVEKSQQMIAIVDYGSGNIKAFENVYKTLDMPFVVASKADTLEKATKIILPGVGAFDQTMELLQNSGMRESLEELVLKRKIPLLGVCVGMQILSQSSEEGGLPGLGWIKGVVRKIKVDDPSRNIRLPHMGWNSISPKRENKILKDLSPESRFYFLHSYYFACFSKEDVVAETGYGELFACAVNFENIYGVQFHPEKSHQNGIQLLKNFGTL